MWSGEDPVLRRIDKFRLPENGAIVLTIFFIPVLRREVIPFEVSKAPGPASKLIEDGAEGSSMQSREAGLYRRCPCLIVELGEGLQLVFSDWDDTLTVPRRVPLVLIIFIPSTNPDPSC